MHSNPLAEMIEESVRKVLEEFIKTPDVRAKRLLDVIEAAEYLSLSRARIYELIAAGELPAVRSGRSTLLDKDDLDSWIKVHKQHGKDKRVA